MMEFLLDLLKAIALAAIPVVAAYIGKNVYEQNEAAKALTENETVKSILDDVAGAITTGVAYVSQTYVDTLKKDDAFTEDAQKEAFQRSLNKVKSLLTSTAKSTLTKLYGDLDEYLGTKIEAEVKQQKPLKPAQPAISAYTGPTSGDVSVECKSGMTDEEKTELIAGLFGLSLPDLKVKAEEYGISLDGITTKSAAVKAVVGAILTTA